MQIIPIEISTLTPLWSGGVNRDCDRLHENGLIGSIRWWYEIFVRSLGGNVCDIISENRCNYEKNKTCCDVCKIFGCTGLSRQFSLRIQENETSKSPKFFIPSGRCHKGRNGKQDHVGGWHLPEGFMGNFSLDFISSNPDCMDVLNILLFMHNHTGFTAKANIGYGIFKINNLESLPQPAQQFNISRNPKTDYPILQNMFFLKVQIPKPDLFGLEEINRLKTRKVIWNDCKAEIKEEYRTELEKYLEDENILFLPTAPIIKNRLRKYKKNGNRIFDKDDILGTVRKSARSSKINISNLYPKDGDWEFRVWGWLDKKNLVSELHEFFKTKIPSIFGFKENDVQIQWREFSSSHDTFLKNETNFENYLRSLLND